MSKPRGDLETTHFVKFRTKLLATGPLGKPFGLDQGAGRVMNLHRKVNGEENVEKRLSNIDRGLLQAFPPTRVLTFLIPYSKFDDRHSIFPNRHRRLSRFYL